MTDPREVIAAHFARMGIALDDETCDRLARDGWLEARESWGHIATCREEDLSP